MDIERLTPNIGACVSGLDLATLVPADRPMIRDLLEQHMVLFFTGQSLTPASFRSFGEVVGDLEVTPLLPGLSGDNDPIHIVEAPAGVERGRFADAWHTDVPFRECPPYATILKPEYLPSLGGDTLWASMYAAYEMMSEPLRRLADSLEVVQAVATPRGTFEFTHPVVRVHPITGRRGLNVNSVFSRRIVDVSVVESARLIEMFCTLATVPDVQVRYRWTPDTVAIWDNRFTQHYATSDYNEPRRMQRLTVIGEPVLGIGKHHGIKSTAAAA
jgi:taurine dioxygenase